MACYARQYYNDTLKWIGYLRTHSLKCVPRVKLHPCDPAISGSTTAGFRSKNYFIYLLLGYSYNMAAGVPHPNVRIIAKNIFPVLAGVPLRNPISYSIVVEEAWTCAVLLASMMSCLTQSVLDPDRRLPDRINIVNVQNNSFVSERCSGYDSCWII